jgi:branched-chain amino acid transport system permease protein
MYTILQNLVTLSFGDETLLIHGSQAQAARQIGSAFVARSQELIILAGIVTLLLMGLLLFLTKLGRAIRAVASNAELSVIFGLSPTRIISYAVAIGCGIAAMSGTLSAYDMDMNPTMGFPLLMRGVVTVILAGTGSLGGLVLAAMFLSLTQNVAAYFLGAQWMDLITYSLLIAFLMWKPLGFKGNILKKTEV